MQEKKALLGEVDLNFNNSSVLISLFLSLFQNEQIPRVKVTEEGKEEGLDPRGLWG